MAAFVLTVVVAALLSAVATPLFAAFARRQALLVRPRSDRWHRQPTPLLGGAGIALGCLSALAVLSPDLHMFVVVGGCALVAFGLGLLDDLRHLAPTTKLVGQVVVAVMLVLGGVRVEIVAFAPLAFLLTLFWIVAIMNAVNLIDNMDGLAAGIVTIAGVSLGIAALPENPAAAVVSGATAGAALGFLIHNFHPAKVFMGDAGSLFLGFLLAAAALLHTVSGAANVGLAVLAPLAILALPIFDTALVTTSRRLAGRPITQGGRDHISHRLVALGLSDRGAVFLLYGVTASLAALGLIAEATGALVPALVALALVGLALFGAFLAQVQVYEGVPRRRPTGRVGTALFVVARFGAEIAIDVVLLTVAYYAAYVLRFEGIPQASWIGRFAESVPLVVGAQMLALVGLGIYRTLWRYLEISDAFAIVRAVTVGIGLAAIVILLAERFEGYSRAVFVLDWVLSCALIVGARAFFLWLRHWFTLRPSQNERRVLIVGATDAGALAARLLGRLTDARYRAVGFLDDDPGKRYRRVSGIPIVGTTGDLEQVIKRLRVDLVFIAVDDAEGPLARRFAELCKASGIEWRSFVPDALGQTVQASP